MTLFSDQDKQVCLVCIAQQQEAKGTKRKPTFEGRAFEKFKHYLGSTYKKTGGVSTSQSRYIYKRLCAVNMNCNRIWNRFKGQFEFQINASDRQEIVILYKQYQILFYESQLRAATATLPAGKGLADTADYEVSSKILIKFKRVWQLNCQMTFSYKTWDREEILQLYMEYQVLYFQDRRFKEEAVKEEQVVAVSPQEILTEAITPQEEDLIVAAPSRKMPLAVDVNLDNPAVAPYQDVAASQLREASSVAFQYQEAPQVAAPKQEVETVRSPEPSSVDFPSQDAPIVAAHHQEVAAVQLQEFSALAFQYQEAQQAAAPYQGVETSRPPEVSSVAVKAQEAPIRAVPPHGNLDVSDPRNGDLAEAAMALAGIASCIAASLKPMRAPYVPPGEEEYEELKKMNRKLMQSNQKLLKRNQELLTVNKEYRRYLRAEEQRVAPSKQYAKHRLSEYLKREAGGRKSERITKQKTTK